MLPKVGEFVIDEREYCEALEIKTPTPIPPNTPSFRLVSDLSFIQPSERELDRFATTSRNLSSIWSKPRGAPFQPPSPESLNKGIAGKPSPSIYCRAISNGIIEVLFAYRSSVLQVEHNLLSHPDPVLAKVTQGLNKFFMLLPPLHDLVFEIERDDIRGSQILNLLYKRCHCGFLN